MNTHSAWAVMAGAALALAAGCSSKDNGSATSGSTSSAGGSSTTGTTSGAGGAGQTLCAKYGGTAAIGMVVDKNVVGTVAGDCRINSFFLALPAAELKHVDECLQIQVEELFGCPGVKYAGSKAPSDMNPCRDMKSIHAGMKVSQGDFDALIDDAAKGLKAAGVSDADIAAAAPALVGMAPDIVADSTNKMPTKTTCK